MSGRERRRGWPIHAYVGANGGGKSLAAVYDTLPSLAAGRPVLSTVKLLHYDAADPLRRAVEHPSYIPLTSLRQLLDADHCDVVLDEVTGVASSRTSMSLPPEIVNLLVQLRRRDVVVRWTSPDWRRADTIIREVTQAVTYCRGYLSERIEDELHQRLWRSPRVFRWITYDAFDFEEFTSSKRETMRRLVRSWYWRPGSDAERAYDTFDAVHSLMDHVTESGTCLNCGGHRARPKCRCPHDAPDIEPGSGPRARPLAAEHGTPSATIPDSRSGRRAAVLGASRG